MMNKLLKRPVSLKIVVPAAVLLVLIMAFLFRGWIRATAEPAAISLTAGRQVQTELDKQLAILGNPFAALGITSTQRTKSCNLSYSSIFHSQITCTATIAGYSKLLVNLKPSLAERSAQLEQAFNANGWVRGNTTISTLGKNIGQGIDSTPDAAYSYKSGKIECLADFNTAFSKPKPPAVNGSIFCFRHYELFGNTSAQPSVFP